ncbi:GDSL-type esterase/lipase family protein [Planomonospora venezuelensis]|uniref:Lysophospholipase L1-like esterase n=1 Tax=Planomonospora venezuelensis TaxID=1999 RepID=A0A841D1B4_PLAVE|nr:GDSL-type esterase/lipase family protein [Planomonospora venezuelensis]MBB5961995.1 lysophospholipase L1-like esterase [Planomonospora venezuelensis]GIN00095.1 lipase [Planomonospora venezuelensis]
MAGEHTLDAEGLAGLLAGAVDAEPTPEGVIPLRLARRSRGQEPTHSAMWVASAAAGVHLRMLTGASRITLAVKITRALPEGLDSREHPASFVAVAGGEAVCRADVDEGDVVRLVDDGMRVEAGEASAVRLDLGEPEGGQERVVEIWLPHTAQVELRSVTSDAPLTPAPSRATHWLHYGSSISHCLEADGPLGPWPQTAARNLGLRLTSMGLAGNAMLDPFAARTIRDIEADVISLKVGINIVNADSMRARTFMPAVHGFLDTVRDGHPDTPIVLVSAVACPIHEDTPGPTVHDGTRFRAALRSLDSDPGALTLGMTRRLLEQVAAERAATDPRLYFVDGLELLGPSDAGRLYDDLHPDQKGYDLMAGRFTALVRGRPDLAAAFGL